MKVVIFGLGNIWRQMEDYADIGSIICFTDNNDALWGKEIRGKRIVSPKEAVRMEYDKIVVASDLYYEAIFRQLHYDFDIPDIKIMGWMQYVQMNCRKWGGHNQASFIEMTRIASGYQGKMLDIGNSFVKYGMYSKRIDNLFSLEALEIWGTEALAEILPIYGNIYEGYCGPDCLKGKAPFEIAMACDILWDADFALVEEGWEEMLGYSKTVVCNLRDAEEGRLEELGRKWNIKYHRYPHSCICVVEKKTAGDIRIYVATHKEAHIPCDDMYIPIHVGTRDFSLNRMVRDDEGENISAYNASLNECTAMYWMWKNAKCRYIGLNHYRRYFIRNGYENELNILNADIVRQILEEYDMILAPKYYTYFQTVEEHLARDVCDAGGISITREILGRRQPEYLQAFDAVFQGDSLYRCNLFVMKKEIFDAYCEWLFSFILEVSGGIDVTGYDPYSARMAGFMAERMLTVWLAARKVRIKEMPFILTEQERGG